MGIPQRRSAAVSTRRSHAFRLGLRPHCRTCHLYTGALTRRCYGCRTLLPGVRPRLAWQATALIAAVALLGLVAERIG